MAAAAAARTSAGLLLHRPGSGAVGAPEVLVGHMGGPFWARKPHAWTVPKGEPLPGEDPHATALREFAEEVGVPAPDGQDVDLGEVRQRAGKVVRVWARAADLDLDAPRGPVSEVTVDWPPRSGRTVTFPELDELRWVPVAEARDLVVVAQAEFLDRLLAHLAAG
ncbi:NUDIX domain-containing protein [Cellulomonas sp.]|uniref:NUDIX domain-containing protein n=1 Tax=Cellulomonas sp. TaxID=40001 RepID=UPI002D65028E|nr:NUDIX domain-containing protein [Cellulomonas sp.]HYQ76917.1 NUDIX domain-containing protein [Cellulomonas sp.]